MRKIISTLLISLSLLLLPTMAYADSTAAKDAAQCGINAAAGVAGCDAPGNGGTSIGDLITKIINILSMLVGAIAVIMLIVAGFRYVTSAGSDQGTAAAKKTITYAIVGLIVVTLAQVIVHFVINAVVNDNPSPASPSSAGSSSSSRVTPGSASPQ
jgi:Type IV secretion system pilin